MEIVEGELKNIDKLEQEERATAPNPDDFLFDLSSEQVEVPMDFNWSGLVSSSEIAVEGSGNSQGS